MIPAKVHYPLYGRIITKRVKRTICGLRVKRRTWLTMDEERLTCVRCQKAF